MVNRNEWVKENESWKTIPSLVEWDEEAGRIIH